MWTQRAALLLTLVIILVVMAVFAYLLIDGGFDGQEEELEEEKPMGNNLWVSLTLRYIATYSQAPLLHHRQQIKD